MTPDRVLLDATAEAVELPSMSGYLEALYGAAPLLAELGAGEVRLHGGTAGDQMFFVAWGFVEVLPERVTILAETALHPEEIDVAEAQQELAHCAEAVERGWRRPGTSTTRRTPSRVWPRRSWLRRRAVTELDSVRLGKGLASARPFVLDFPQRFEDAVSSSRPS